MDLVKLFNIGADKHVTINVHGTDEHQEEHCRFR